MSQFTHMTPEGEASVEFEVLQDTLRVAGQSYECDGHSVWIGGRRIPFWTHREGDQVSVWLDGEVFTFTHRDPRQRSEAASTATASGTVKAQMPGKILSLSVKEGDSVSQGQSLMIMESMKMELSLDAPFDGKVEAVQATVGQMVALGDTLVRIGGTEAAGAPG